MREKKFGKFWYLVFPLLSAVVAFHLVWVESASAQQNSSTARGNERVVVPTRVPPQDPVRPQHNTETLNLENRPGFDLSQSVGRLQINQRTMFYQVKNLLLDLRMKGVDISDVPNMKRVIYIELGHGHQQIYEKYFLEPGWVRGLYESNAPQFFVQPGNNTTAQQSNPNQWNQPNQRSNQNGVSSGEIVSRAGEGLPPRAQSPENDPAGQQRPSQDGTVVAQQEQASGPSRNRVNSPEARLADGRPVKNRGLFGSLRGVGIEVDLSGTEAGLTNSRVNITDDEDLFGEQLSGVGTIRFFGEDGRVDLNISSTALTRNLENGNSSSFLRDPNNADRPIPVSFVELNEYSADYLKYPSEGRTGWFYRAGAGYRKYRSERSGFGVTNLLDRVADQSFNLESSSRIDKDEIFGYFNTGYQISGFDGHCILRPEVGVAGSSLSFDNTAINFGAEGIVRTRQQDQIPVAEWFADLYCKVDGQYFPVNNETDAFARAGLTMGVPLGSNFRVDLTGEAVQPLSLNPDLYVPVDPVLMGIRDTDTIFGAKVMFGVLW